jgi:hypothetical protein
VQNGDQFLLPQGRLFFISQNQLRSEYVAVTLPIETRPGKLPVVFLLEPEYLSNRVENRLPSEERTYYTQTNRYLLGLKMTSNSENWPVNFFLYPKYSAFLFRNDLAVGVARQDMLSLDASLRVSLLKKKLLFSPNIRVVHFSGNNTVGRFTNLSCRVEIPNKQWYWFLAGENLLNNTEFVRQSIFPNLFVDEQSRVFGRFVQAGVEFKWK